MPAPLANKRGGCNTGCRAGRDVIGWGRRRGVVQSVRSIENSHGFVPPTHQLALVGR